MEYKINPAAYSSIFAVPKAVVEENLLLASPTALKALLLMLCRGEPLSVEELAKALKRDKGDVADAMVFWEQQGILLPAGKTAAPVPAKQAPPAPADVPVAGLTAEPASEKKTAPELPLARPTHEQIAIRLQECEDFKVLFQEAQQKLGKTIGYEGQSILIMLHDTYDLPVEVILMLLEYAKSKGKTGYRYIASIGKEWSEKEIDSLESAEEYIREQHTTDTVWAAFRELTGAKNRNPTAKQKRYLISWSRDMGFSDEMIALAYEICIDNTNKLSLEYMDRVLLSWQKSGVKTPADAQRAQEQWSAQRFGKKEPRPPRGSKGESVFSSDASYDLQAFGKRAIGLEDLKPPKND